MTFRRVILASLALITFFPNGTASSQSPTLSLNAEAELSEVMQNEPDAAPIFAAFKNYFPDQYEGMKRRFAYAIRRGASPAEASAIGTGETQRFVAANRRNIAVASTSRLVAYAQAQAKLLETLQREDVPMCARFSMGNRTPSTYVHPLVRTATSRLAVIMIRAAREGIDNPINRLYQTVSDEDGEAYVRAIAAQGVDPSFIEIMSNDDKLDRATKPEQCAAGVINARAIIALPPEAAARWAAFMLTS